MGTIIVAIKLPSMSCGTGKMGWLIVASHKHIDKYERHENERLKSHS